jgi:hypothetical protein
MLANDKCNDCGGAIAVARGIGSIERAVTTMTIESLSRVNGSVISGSNDGGLGGGSSSRVATVTSLTIGCMCLCINNEKRMQCES